jgi:circadian clock protein KaiC
MRVSTGLPELDKLMGGGLLEKSFNLLSGSPGAGKTLFVTDEEIIFCKSDGIIPKFILMI